MLRQHGCVGCVLVVAGLLWGGIAHAQPGVARDFRTRGPRLGPIALAGMAPVQKELGLEGEALSDVKKVVTSFEEELKTELEKLGMGSSRVIQKMSRDEKMELNEKRAAVMLILNEKFVPQLKEALAPAQFTRVQQIHWQFGGSEALLTDPDLGKLLDITAEQKDRIIAINREMLEKNLELYTTRGGDGDPKANRAKVQQLMKERNDKATEVLTKDQQEKYVKMIGMPFDIGLLMVDPNRPDAGQ